MHDTMTCGLRTLQAVPDTLDLAERARLAIYALTLSMNPQKDYDAMGSCVGQFFLAAKYLEALPMMRVMSGSEEFLDVEQAAMAHMLAQIGEDGVWYCPNNSPERRAGRNYQPTDEDYGTPYANARFMLALMAWHHRDGDARWLEAAGRLAQGLKSIAIRKDDYAYYPDAEYGFDYAYLRQSGFTQTAEPSSDFQGYEGTFKFYQANQIRALTRWHQVTGDAEALELAGAITRSITRPQFWDTMIADTIGSQVAQFRGHTHGNMTALRGILTYAAAVGDTRLIDFARQGYEYLRNYTVPRTGWVQAWVGPNPIGHRLACETCTTSGLIAVAAKLTELGVGDYWDDIDEYTRNHLVESQLVNRAYTATLIGQADEESQLIATGGWTIANTRGSFQGASELIGLTSGPCACCTGNGASALYYAWEGILKHDGDTVTVNMPLNRVSPWADVFSHLPHEGKVEVRNKTAKTVAVRLPKGVALAQAACTVNGHAVTPVHAGRQLIATGLTGGETITITFPVAEETATYSISAGLYARGSVEIPQQDYTLTSRGNTVVDITPRSNVITGPEPIYPLYQRDALRTPQAPLAEKAMYVSPIVLPWS